MERLNNFIIHYRGGNITVKKVANLNLAGRHLDLWERKPKEIIPDQVCGLI